MGDLKRQELLEIPGKCLCKKLYHSKPASDNGGGKWAIITCSVGTILLHEEVIKRQL